MHQGVCIYVTIRSAYRIQAAGWHARIVLFIKCDWSVYAAAAGKYAEVNTEFGITTRGDDGAYRVKLRGKKVL